MGRTMVRAGLTYAELHGKSVQVSKRTKLHQARIALRLHSDPIRRFCGLGRMIWMCDQRWEQHEPLQGCPDRREALADFLKYAIGADVDEALRHELISSDEAELAAFNERTQELPVLPIMGSVPLRAVAVIA